MHLRVTIADIQVYGPEGDVFVTMSTRLPFWSEYLAEFGELKHTKRTLIRSSLVISIYASYSTCSR